MLAGILKQNTATTITIGQFVDDADGKTPETALTISQADVQLSKNDGAFAQKNDAAAATHKVSGYYSCALNATDANTLGMLSLVVQEAGALGIRHDYLVVSANVWDALVGDTDKLQSDMVQIEGADATDSIASLDDFYGDARSFYAQLGQALIDVFKNLLQGALAFTVDTATFAPTTTEFECSLTGANDNIYRDQSIRFETGPNAGLVFRVASSEGTVANPNTKTKLTVTLMPDAPTNGDEATVYGRSA